MNPATYDDIFAQQAVLEDLESRYLTQNDMTTGYLNESQIHPASREALAYIKDQPLKDLCVWQEAFASSAIEGNVTAALYSETLDRAMTGDSVGERYILALAWFIYRAKNPEPSP